MRLLLIAPMRSFTGEILKDGPTSDLLLRSVLLVALSGNGEAASTCSDVAKQFALGVKVATAGDEIEIESEDAVLLKKLVSKRFSVLVSGQVGLMLDGKSTGIIPAMRNTEQPNE